MFYSAPQNPVGTSDWSQSFWEKRNVCENLTLSNIPRSKLNHPIPIKSYNMKPTINKPCHALNLSNFLH